MHKIKLILTTISLATTTFAIPIAAVPCYDTSQFSKYHNACYDFGSGLASDNWRNTGPSPIYNCVGNDPGFYYGVLQQAGIATCVCGFVPSGGTINTYTGEWGTCNGACQSSTFTCQGTTPIGSNNVAANPSSSSIVNQPVASSSSAASSTPISSPTSGSSSKSGAGHERTPAKISSIMIAFVLAAVGMN